MNDQQAVEKRSMRGAVIVRFGQWAIVAVAVIVTLGLVVMFGQRRNTFEPWSLGNPIGEIVRLQPGQSVSQTIEIPGGGVRGFSAVIRAFPRDGDPVAINLRVRRTDAAREILRESVALVSEEGHSTISTGQLPPVDTMSAGKLDFEIEIAGTSQGELTILASRTTNIGPGLLTINGAPTDSELRMEITPILSVGPLGLVRMTTVNSTGRVAAYLVALGILSVVAAALLTQTFKKLSGVSPSSFIDVPTVLLGVPLATLAVVDATSRMVVGDIQPYLDEIRDGFWRAAFALPILVLLIAIAMSRLAGLWQRLVAQPWNGLVDPRKIWRSVRSQPWQYLARPIYQWRFLVGGALWLIGLAVVLDLWRMDGATQVIAAAAEISMGVAVLAAMLSSSSGRSGSATAGAVNERAIVVAGVVVSVVLFALVLFVVSSAIDDSIAVGIRNLFDRLRLATDSQR